MNLVSKIKLTLDSSEVKRKIAKLKTAFRAMGQGMGTAFKTAGKVAAGVFAGITAATVLYARKFAREMDRIGKLSKRFGETAESMQRIELAAKLGGTSLEVVAKGVQNLVRGLVEAEQGSATYADAVKQLGLDASRLIDLPMEEQLLAIARAYTAAGADARSLAAMQDLLGRAGPELAAMVAEGPEALAKALEDAMVVSGRTVRAMEMVNDAIARMGNVVRGSFGQALEAVVPTIEEKLGVFEEKFREFGQRAGWVFGQALKGNAGPILAFFDFVARKFGEMFLAAARYAVDVASNDLSQKLVERMGGSKTAQVLSLGQSKPMSELVVNGQVGLHQGRSFRDFQMEGRNSLGADESMDRLIKATEGMEEEMRIMRQRQQDREDREASYQAWRERVPY